MEADVNDRKNSIYVPCRGFGLASSSVITGWENWQLRGSFPALITQRRDRAGSPEDQSVCPSHLKWLFGKSLWTVAGMARDRSLHFYFGRSLLPFKVKRPTAFV